MAFEFEVTWDGVELCNDLAECIRLLDVESIPEVDRWVRRHEPAATLWEEVERLMPVDYMLSAAYQDDFPGRNLAGVALNENLFCPPFKLGQWFYPTGARRWSVLRMLATSGQVKKLLKKAQGAQYTARRLVMQATPTGGLAAHYRVESPMLFLPPRPLAEYASGGFDGLFVVTFVDERWRWRYWPVTMHPERGTTWTELLEGLATVLGISLTVGGVESVYGRPEPDSNLWTNLESAATLLDALALNVGKTVVRNLDGTYQLMDVAASVAQATAQRSGTSSRPAPLPIAGGTAFNATATLPAGDTTPARGLVAPARVDVSFPKYALGAGATTVGGQEPHFVNSRGPASRWVEDGFGDVWTVSVPLASGGSYVRNVVGQGVHAVRDTAKAFVSDPDLGVSPTNVGELTQLALRLARDFYDGRAALALDETYAGTFLWQPEGLHDVVWTYSEMLGGATCRVFHGWWNSAPVEYQHRLLTQTQGVYNGLPPGMAGPAVCQAWRDSAEVGAPSKYTPLLSQGITLTALATSMTPVDFLPTQNRWRGQVESEIILFEGTSGGTTVSIAQRGLDGTLPVAHPAGAAVTLLPNKSYAVNLVTAEKGQWIYPHEHTSGGLHGVHIVPQTQTVRVFDGPVSGVQTSLVSGGLQSGQVLLHDPTGPMGGDWIPLEYVWVKDRGGRFLASGGRFDGQFVGYSDASKNKVAPIYAVSAEAGGGSNVNTVNNYGDVNNYNSDWNFYNVEITVDNSTFNIVNNTIFNFFETTVTNFYNTVNFNTSIVNVTNSYFTFDITTIVNIYNLFVTNVVYNVTEYTFNETTINNYTFNSTVVHLNLTVNVEIYNFNIYLPQDPPIQPPTYPPPPQDPPPPGTTIIFVNVSNEYTITFIHNVSVFSWSQTNIVLGPGCSITFVWNGFFWVAEYYPGFHTPYYIDFGQTTFLTFQALFFYIQLTADVDIYNFGGGYDGRWVYLINTSQYCFVLRGGQGICLPANTANNQLRVCQGQSVMMHYDRQNNCWRVCGQGPRRPDPTQATSVNVLTQGCVSATTVEAGATGDVTINSATATDITGASCTVTLNKADRVILNTVFEFDCNGAGTSNDKFSGLLLVGGTEQTKAARFISPGASGGGTVGQTYVLSLPAGDTTIKLQAKRSSGSGSAIVRATNTGFALQSAGRFVGVRRMLTLPEGSSVGQAGCVAEDASCCPPQTGCSGGGGGDGDPGTLDIGCCSDRLLPEVLTLTVLDNGGCTCLASSYTLTWDEAQSAWLSEPLGAGCAATIGAEYRWTLSCEGTSVADFRLNTANFGPFGPDEGTCDFLSLTWSNGVFGCGTVSVIITE